jgi:hypothetical protein
MYMMLHITFTHKYARECVLIVVVCVHVFIKEQVLQLCQ